MVFLLGHSDTLAHVSAETRTAPDIYVEIAVNAPMDRVWELTRQPELHQRWDLRFSRIEYLPRPDLNEPQRSLYETRIGFGLSIRGTGESVGEREIADGSRTSALRLASNDWTSLIREGSGYWRYVPAAEGLRFFTWYDYQVRFGFAGRGVDRIFRPLIGRATAWSFDAMRLWAEDGQMPELSLAMAAIDVCARMTVALVWIWHGLVPKLLFHHLDELRMLREEGVPAVALPLIGAGEVAFGLALLVLWRDRRPLLVSAGLMVLATIAVAVRSPGFLPAAFNPVTLNASVCALSLIAWIAARHSPSAARCLRVDPGSISRSER